MYYNFSYKPNINYYIISLKFFFLILTLVLNLFCCKNKIINSYSLSEDTSNSLLGVACGANERTNNRGGIRIYVQLDSLSYLSVLLGDSLGLIDYGTILLNADWSKKNKMYYNNAQVELREIKMAQFNPNDRALFDKASDLEHRKFFVYPCSDIGMEGEMKTLECEKCEVKIYVKSLKSEKRIYKIETDDSCRFKNRFVGKIKTVEIPFENYAVHR